MSNVPSGSARPTIRTIETLIGREDLLNDVMQKFRPRNTTPTIIFLTGEGGNGKTRMLYALAEMCRADDRYTVASQEIDCYDENSHSKQQFAAQLSEVMPEAVDLSNYRRTVRELQRAEQSNDHELSIYRREVEIALEEDLKRASQKKRIVIMLDTIERFVYVPASVQNAAQIASSWTWISEELMRIPNITWILAGRSTASSLFGNLKIITIDVPHFTEAGVRDYVEALIQRANDEGNDLISSRLGTLLDAELFPSVYQQSAGRPLNVSLLADLMTVTNLPSKDVGATQQAIINRLMELEEIGVMLGVFGRLRRGVDIDMLRIILKELKGWPPERVSRVFDDFKSFSFVKKPRGERYFLHDIMYEWLDDYLYKEPRERRDGQKVYAASINFCKQQEKIAIQELDAIFVPIQRGHERFDLDVYNSARNHRRQALLDRLYYELCNNPMDGWRFYLRYTFDAIFGNDTILDVLLLALMLNGLSELERRKQLEGSGPTFNLVRGVGLIRPVARAFADNNYELANQEAEKIRQSSLSELPDEARTSSLLDIWHAAALIQLAGADNLHRAEQLLNDAIIRLEILLKEPATTKSEQAEDIRERVGLTFAHHVLGDYYRQRDKAREASIAYREAVKYGRETRVLTILTTALNRLGLVLSAQGYLEDAVALLEDALEIRQNLGLHNETAGTFSALGIVLTSQGSYQSAINNLKKALGIYIALDDKLNQVRNLANLAEATRRYASTLDLRGTQEGFNLLLDSRFYAEDACTICEQDQTIAVRSVVRAWIERGCTLRELARETFLQKIKVSLSLPRLISESEAALRKAAAIAHEKSLWVLELDALANIPFLYYHVGNYLKAQQSLEEIWNIVDAKYQILPNQPIPPILNNEPVPAFWPHIAKLVTLRGHLAFERFQETNKEDEIAQCAEAYMLSMEYNEHYSQNTTGTQRSRQQIFDRLRKFDVPTLRLFSKGVQQAARTYGFERTKLQERLERRTLWFAEP